MGCTQHPYTCPYTTLIKGLLWALIMKWSKHEASIYGRSVYREIQFASLNLNLLIIINNQGVTTNLLGCIILETMNMDE